jgi:hypothetical protein
VSSHENLDPGHKNRLTDVDLPRFAGEGLFDRLARAVCHAGVLPRKELYESWEMARRVHRHLRRRRRRRVIDLACGHGLLGAMLVILDGGAGGLEGGQGIDPRPPASSTSLLAALRTDFARVARFDVVTGGIADAVIGADDIVVSCHACGALTDDVIAVAVAARAFVAVLPCCHVLPHRSEKPNPLAGWLDGSLAIDVDRAHRLAAAGYGVHTSSIDPAITPKNRLLIAWPNE